MNVLYIQPYDGELSLIQSLLPEHQIIAATAVDELPSETLANIDILSVFVSYAVTPAVLASLPNLRFIATRSAGFDHLDMARIGERGITVSRVPHYGTRTVAEYAIALMFALARNVHLAYADMQQNATIGPRDVYEGFDLAGKTLGVVGTGAIGRNVCEIARGIGMQVLCYDVVPNEDLVARGIARYESLETVLSEADIVTVHVPSLPETFHLLNAERIALMKHGSFLINTARGEIVDTQALVVALREGRLAGAGIDVLEREHELREEVALLADSNFTATDWKTLLADHVLIDMPNVIVTPHIAFNTREAKREITEITAQNITAFAAGSPSNLVP